MRYRAWSDTANSGHSAWRRAPAVSGAFAMLAPASDQSSKLAALILGNGNVVHPYICHACCSRRARAPADAFSAGGSGATGRRSLRESLRHNCRMDPNNRFLISIALYMLNTLLRDSD